MSNIFGVGRGMQIYKTGLGMGMKIGVDAEKLARTLIFW